MVFSSYFFRRDLPDSMKTEWSASLVYNVIQEYATKHDIQIVSSRNTARVDSCQI
jgi:hypothetical protein